MPDEGRLANLPGICNTSVAAHEIPGGVLLVGTHDTILSAFAFGNRSLVPDVELATLDTIYDLASLTKPFITATLVMQAVELGLLNLEEPISRFLPIPSDNRIAEVTPRLLMLHTAGLPAGRPLAREVSDTESAIGSMVVGGLVAEPGAAFTYSDVGFHLLGRIVEVIFGEGIATLAEKRILAPLGTRDLAYGVSPDRVKRTAPTETIDGVPLRGVVHDPAARQMGGIAGHAGLFGTAADCARFCRMILRRGELDENRILRPATVDRMIEPVAVPGGKKRALGWDADTQYSNPRGEIFPVRGVGHTGFTGPSVWIDPPSGTYIVLLTNRLHPDGTGSAVRLRRLVANVVASAVLD